MVDDNDRALRRGWLGLSLGLLVGIYSCGDPNVPLTRPPENAFRVSSPRPRRVDRPRDARSRSTPASRSGVSIAQITAEFLDIPWSTQAQPPSLLRVTAEFLQIPLPPPLPTPSPTAPQGTAPLNLEGLPTDPEQLEQILEQMEGEISPEQRQQLLEMMRQQGQDPALHLEAIPDLNQTQNQKLPDAP